MRKFLIGLGVVLVAAVAYLLLWPVPVDPVVWSAPQAPGYASAHAVNTRLANLQHVPLSGDIGPEHVVVRDGWVYMALANGTITRIRPDGSQREVVARTGGRPLGFDFDAEGALIVADPMWGEHGGLLRVTGTGDAAKVELLTSRPSAAAEPPILYIDAVVVARSGRIYFTDATSRFGAKAWGGTFTGSVLDILEHRSSGRVLEYDPATRVTRVLMTDLCFANGIALTGDERHVLVNETGEYRIWKVAVDANGVSAQQAAATPRDSARVLLSNLPGYPDNLMRGRDGRIWAGFAKPRAGFADRHAGRPWVRKLALRLPKALWPVPAAYGHVFAFDEDGKVLVDLQDPSGAYPETTAVTETEDRLYIQSLHAATLGWLPKSSAGL